MLGKLFYPLRKRYGEIRQGANETLVLEHRDSSGSGGVLPPASVQRTKPCTYSVNIKENAALLFALLRSLKILEQILHTFSLQFTNTREVVAMQRWHMILVLIKGKLHWCYSFLCTVTHKVPFRSFSLRLNYWLRYTNENRLPIAEYGFSIALGSI